MCKRFYGARRFWSGLSAALCDALIETGDWRLEIGDFAVSSLQSPISHSRTILNYLERANLFIVPLDNERRWYRYHHLFAEFLRQRLHEAEPEQVSQLYQSAAQWLAEQDQLREAIPYALAANDDDLAAELIETIAPQILEHEDASIVQSWIDKLPKTMLAKRPFLNLYYAWAIITTGASDEIERYLETAVTLSQHATPAEQQAISGMIAAYRAYAAMFTGQHETSGALAEQALATLPPERLALRARTLAVLGNSHNYSGRLIAALQAYSDAANLCEQNGDVSNATFNLCSQAEIYLDQAQLSQANHAYQQALNFSQRHSGTTDNPFTGFAHCSLGRVARERNELETAVTHLQRGISLCREWRQAYSLAIGLIDMGILLTAQGEWDQAERVFQETRALAQTASPVWGVGMIDALRARLALAQGNVNAAVQWADTCGFHADDAPTYELTIVYFTLARALIAQSRCEDALTVLNKITQLHQPIGRHRLVMEAAIWKAVAFAQLGKNTQGITQLKLATSIAEPEKYVRVFLDAGAPIATLLTNIPQTPFTQKLLATFGIETHPPHPLTPSPHLDLFAPLNKRELAILKLMAAGLSNRDIGDELFLSVNTIRWYASQIYSKMGVSGRGTAVARAHELSIL